MAEPLEVVMKVLPNGEVFSLAIRITQVLAPFPRTKCGEKDRLETMH